MKNLSITKLLNKEMFASLAIVILCSCATSKPNSIPYSNGDGIETSVQQSNKTIKPEDVAVYYRMSDVDGLVYVQTKKETSGWGGGATAMGTRRCIEALQKKAAKLGCIAILITDYPKEPQPWTVTVIAEFYKKP